jgi:hypothetical protein
MLNACVGRRKNGARGKEKERVRCEERCGLLLSAAVEERGRVRQGRRRERRV